MRRQQRTAQTTYKTRHTTRHTFCPCWFQTNSSWQCQLQITWNVHQSPRLMNKCQLDFQQQGWAILGTVHYKINSTNSMKSVPCSSIYLHTVHVVSMTEWLSGKQMNGPEEKQEQTERQKWHNKNPTLIFVSCLPSYSSGVHHCLCDWFFNSTIEVVTFRLRGWCTLDVFLLPAFTHLRHGCPYLLSLCDGMHVCTD